MILSLSVICVLIGIGTCDVIVFPRVCDVQGFPKGRKLDFNRISPLSFTVNRAGDDGKKALLHSSDIYETSTDDIFTISVSNSTAGIKGGFPVRKLCFQTKCVENGSLLVSTFPGPGIFLLPFEPRNPVPINWTQFCWTSGTPVAQINIQIRVLGNCIARVRNLFMRYCIGNIAK